MILVADTETSGLLRDDLPAEDPSQPHLVQLGAHLLDHEYRRMAVMEVLIQPNGWTVEPEAFAVHGIPEVDCVRYGVDARAALALFQQMCMKARVIVAHHAIFDRKIVAAQLAKVGSNGHWWQAQSRKFRCSMELSADVCKLPGQYGSYKFPTLEEAHRHFYPDRKFVSTHRAGGDIGACTDIYRALVNLGVA